MSNTKKFVPHIMALYNQIGYLYTQLNMKNAAVDYFKKQLIIAWQNNDLKNEMLAYEQLSIANYYLGEEDNIERALQYSERFYSGLREDKKSTLRITWVNFINRKDSAAQSDYEIIKLGKGPRVNMASRDTNGFPVFEKNRYIQCARKSTERPDVQKYYHFRIGCQF